MRHFSAGTVLIGFSDMPFLLDARSMQVKYGCSDKHHLGLTNGLCLDNVALLLEVQQEDGATVAEVADLDVVLTVSVLDVDALVLKVVLSG